MATHKVKIINPKPTGKKKAPKKRKKPVAAKKKASKKRSRKKRSTTTTTTKKTTKRRSNPKPAPAKRRRRSNPASAGVDIMQDGKDAGYRLLGKTIGAYAVTRYGTVKADLGGPSPMVGARWSMRSHGINLAAGYAASYVARKFAKLSAKDAKNIFAGAIDLSVSKAVWHEIIGRFGQRSRFGASEMALPAQGVPDGAIYDSGDGTRYIKQGSQFIPMQGINEVNQLGAAMVSANQLGASMVQAGPLGDASSHMPDAFTAVMNTPQPQAANLPRGYDRRNESDPYRAAYAY